MEEIIKKYRVGNPLSDEECSLLYKFFSEMEHNCSLLGQYGFGLFEYEMGRNKRIVEAYMRERKI